jgi:glycosyltransferase involved in cell wall biosynthesis
MLCSITFIVFGRYECTKITLESLFRCTKYPYELIVVENRSDEKTREYLLSQQKKIDHLVLNKGNVGKVNANNIGWRISRGDYIATVENDILLTENWLSKCIDYLDKIPKLGLISPTNHDKDRYERGKTKNYEVIKRRINGKEIHIPKIGVVPGTIVAKREIIEKVGLHKTSGRLYEHSCPEYSKRMQKYGYLVAYPCDFDCYHIEPQNKIFDTLNLSKKEYQGFKLSNNKEKGNNANLALLRRFLKVQ